VLGAERVVSWGLPLMAAEDFGYFSAERPGCYLFFGTAEEGACAVVLAFLVVTGVNDAQIARTTCFTALTLISMTGFCLAP
jgi:metal-dependent amidase/aminoacylase/carboxypeptidase family protein